MSSDDEDSMTIHVELPKEEKAKVASLISSWEFRTYSEDPLELKMYLVVSDVYLKNVIEKKEEPRLSEDQKRRLGS
jgi:hypothetical protein